LGQTVNLATNTASGGQAAGDVISGFENLIGGSSVDNLTGDDNANFIDGGSSGDTINGGLGDDTLLGSAGNDTLIGGGGNDRIDGGSQNDSIIGGDGMDTLTGGANNDSFVYNSPTEGQDVITDFAVSGTSQDSFRFRSAAFGGIAVGTLTSANFNSTSNPTFLYNGVSGVLSYDSDGTNGPNAAVNIATLQGTPALTEARITIF
jgi:Ca2+-binding RTX toxin-like protein